MEINELMQRIINDKFEELKIFDGLDDRFGKIKLFEGNAVGQIGETFVKSVFANNDIPMDDIGKEIIHDEYDIITNNQKIEIKTARKGLKNDTFQFNGINPVYNHAYIILVGITTKNIYYKIIEGKSTYNHQTRKYYLTVDGKLKQLVAMNPGNSVNFKLTLPLKQLKPIETFVEELKSLFVS